MEDTSAVVILDLQESNADKVKQTIIWLLTIFSYSSFFIYEDNVRFKQGLGSTLGVTFR